MRADCWIARTSPAPQGPVQRVPGDKSITHRALLLAGVANGVSRIHGPLPSGDALATRRVLAGWGVEVREQGGVWEVLGRGLRGLKTPTSPLDCGRSGTTLRLAAGIAAGQAGSVTLSADAQLCARPMRRIRDPLRALGATVGGPDDGTRAPLTVTGGALRPLTWEPSVASAQVKSCVLLAGLCAGVEVTVVEQVCTRDHTERLLAHLGASLRSVANADGQRVTLSPTTSLPCFELHVPGDPSSASFLWTWAALTPGGAVTVADVALNPGRTGFLRTLTSMGAHVELDALRIQGGEPLGRVRVSAGGLRATDVRGAELVALVDEVPLLALLATQAQGTTRIRDAAELRHKESDRLATTAAELNRLGARVRVLPDGLEVEGPTPLIGAEVDSHGDHRLAMTLTVAGLIASGETTIASTACHSDSFPGFVACVRALGGDVEEVEVATC